MTKTFILCHTQDFIIDSIEHNKYKNFNDYYFVFMGMGQINKIKNINNVIICRDLPNNIEEQKNCLQYCGWYSLYHNEFLDTDYIRIIDYDVDIININNKTSHCVKSGLGFGFDDHFLNKFGNHRKFVDIMNRYANGDIRKAISNYSKEFNQDKWFSSIDVLINKETFSKFMEWFKPIAEEIKDEYYFGMFFERVLTIFLIVNNVDYNITENEVTHNQLQSHPYY